MNDRIEERTDASATEVELDAEDLAALATCAHAEKREPSLTTRPDASSIDTTAVAPATSSAVSSARIKHRTVLRVVAPVGLLVAAVATAGAIYTRSLDTDTPQLARPTIPAPEVMPDRMAEEVDPEPQAEPVRFVNPFDKSEVFEFPPGTTQEDARDEVAKLLLERGMERRATDRRLRERTR